jgi:hypothetical protein
MASAILPFHVPSGYTSGIAYHDKHRIPLFRSWPRARLLHRHRLVTEKNKHVSHVGLASRLEFRYQRLPYTTVSFVGRQTAYKSRFRAGSGTHHTAEFYVYRYLYHSHNHHGFLPQAFFGACFGRLFRCLLSHVLSWTSRS